MQPLRTWFAALLLLCVSAVAQTAVPPLPKTPKRPVVDEYFGTKVTDNYQWLEDSKNPQVEAWTAAENAHARAMLDALPIHAEIQQFLKSLANASSPAYYDLEMRGGKLFAMNAQPHKQQDMLVTLRSPDDLASKHVVLDPSQIDPTNSTAIQFYVPSQDGSKVAVSLAKGGTESGTVHVYDVATGKALPDVVPHVTAIGGGSLVWKGDGSGFYYTHYPKPGERPAEDLNFYQQIYFHKLGTDAAQDTYVIGKDWPRIAETTLTSSEDGKYLLATVENGDGGDYEHFLCGPDGKWTQITHFGEGVKAIAIGRDALYMMSRDNAPRGKILRAPLATPELKYAKVIVPQSAAVIQDFSFALAGLQPSFIPTRSLLYVTELVGGPTEIHIFTHEGKAVGTVPAEPVSTITHMLPLKGDEILFGNVSYVDPMAWFRYDPATKKVIGTAMREISPVSFAEVEVVREFATSKDGTKVPLNIFRRKGTKLDGKNPAILTGYGGFDISMTPGFDPGLLPWLDAGGILAIANLRGGGEFGEEWHQQGMLTHKQNVFDDFIACSEYLIKQGYTNPSRLGIEGGSNGGLLMGAVLTQRPDLYRAVVSVAGLYDMLRYETTQNGQYNVTEYGSVKDPEQFKALYAYSPYHHVEDGVKYPAVLLMVGENDPRVAPWHSKKFAAALQAATSSQDPVLLISFSNAGHGGIGSAEDQRIAMATYAMEFLYDQLGVKWVAPEMTQH
ncbi:MAG TPA: prolyl oligopeptidase family serine peptidase [Terriglobales bacterium]|nr:prolyl oligopeptidase family serine peptidase [Terriglobales bacterium]